MLGAAGRSVEDESQRGDGEARRWLIKFEWEKPDPSTTWRGAGGVAVAIAATAFLAALTLSTTTGPKVSLLLAVGIASLVVAIACLLAHLDVNRGRKAKRSEIIEERRED